MANESVAGLVTGTLSATLPVPQVQLTGIVRALRPDGVTLEDYERLMAAILAGLERSASPDEVAEDVRARVPMFAGLWDHMRTPAGLLMVLSVVVSVASGIPGWVTLLGGDEDPPPAVNVEIHDHPLPTEGELERLVDQRLREAERRPEAPVSE
jgi:hypothetical protein